MNILITGSSSGFGKEMAIKLAKAGHVVFAGMRNIEGRNATTANSLRAVSSQLDGQIKPVELDVSTDAAVDTGVASVFSALDGPLDVVINNAGLYVGGLNETISVMQVQNMLNVNVLGALRVTRAALPNMRAHGRGTLISITSDVSRFSLPMSGLYTATKAALETIAETYAYELGPIGLESLIIQPGAFNTGIMQKASPISEPERMSGYGPTLEKAQAMADNFMALVQENFADGGPSMVADAVVNLLEQPYGKRPLRTVVDPSPIGEHARQMNTAISSKQSAFLRALDSEFPVAPSEAA